MIALSVIGYPLAAVLSQLIGGNTQIVTVPYRLLIVGLSLSAVVLSTRQPIRNSAKSLVVLFSIAYLMRLIVDYSFGHPLAQEALVRFIAISLIPLLGIAFAFDSGFNERKLKIVLGYLGGVFILCVHYFREMGNIGGIHDREHIEALNPISLRHAAASVSIVGIVIAMSSHRRERIIGVLLTCTSIPIILSAGSRGPIVAVVFALIVVLSTRAKRALYAIPAIIPAFIIIDFESTAIQRLINSFGEADRSGLIRLSLQREAFTDFWDSPIFGKHFVDPNLTIFFYPHNQFIETLMALGLIGGVLLASIYFRIVQQYVSGFGVTHPLLLGLLAQYSVSFQFSGALWGGAGFFLLAYCWCALRSRKASSISSEPISPFYSSGLKRDAP